MTFAHNPGKHYFYSRQSWQAALDELEQTTGAS